MVTPTFIGAIIVSILLLFALLSIIKTTFKTALFIALIVFGIQIFTGIGPQQIWQQVLQFMGGLGAWFQRWGGNYKPPSDFKDKQSMLWALQLLGSIDILVK